MLVELAAAQLFGGTPPSHLELRMAGGGGGGPRGCISYKAMGPSSWSQLLFSGAPRAGPRGYFVFRLKASCLDATRASPKALSLVVPPGSLKRPGLGRPHSAGPVCVWPIQHLGLGQLCLNPSAQCG